MNAKLKLIIILIDKTNILDLKLWPIIAGTCRNGNSLAITRMKDLGNDISYIRRIMTCEECRITFRNNLQNYFVDYDFEHGFKIMYLCYQCLQKNLRQCIKCKLYTKAPTYFNNDVYCVKCTFNIIPIFEVKKKYFGT